MEAGMFEALVVGLGVPGAIVAGLSSYAVHRVREWLYSEPPPFWNPVDDRSFTLLTFQVARGEVPLSQVDPAVRDEINTAVGRYFSLHYFGPAPASSPSAYRDHLCTNCIGTGVEPKDKAVPPAVRHWFQKVLDQPADLHPICSDIKLQELVTLAKKKLELAARGRKVCSCLGSDESCSECSTRSLGIGG